MSLDKSWATYPDKMYHLIESPFEALDMHLSTWEWQGTSEADFILDHLLKTVYPQDPKVMQAMGIFNANIHDSYRESIHRTLRESETIFVTEDMVDIAQHWAKETDPVPLHPDALPLPTGLLIFAKPYMLADYDRDFVTGLMENGVEHDEVWDHMLYAPIRGIGWHRDDGITTKEGKATDGLVIWLFADSQIAYDREWSVHPHTPMFALDTSGWVWGQEWKEGPWIPEEWTPGSVTPHVVHYRLFLLQIWGLMQDFIIRQKPYRALQRRHQRSGIKVPEDGALKILHLRRILDLSPKSEREEGETDIEWSHRWVVRGHWRRINKGTPEERLVWVRPYIKGPKGKPLVLKERLTVLHR